ncbi:nephronectin isoform X2 [Echeneis naucrates]|uniref:nephronectin isoform X2 n=1 Tax=Echeneis naucrates TaxID=173247 RepID=UPI00111363ED|nr:nephronectin-like isoform X2 [Echeneis naucrates]
MLTRVSLVLLSWFCSWIRGQDQVQVQVLDYESRTDRAAVLSGGLCRYGNSVECCWGWTRTGGGRCRPHCQQGCKHGECVGPDKCKCHPGFTGKACNQDLNECGVKPRPCKHRCMNVIGSYKCYCLDGYTLQPDGSCRNARTCYHANCQYGCEVSKGAVRCTCPSPGLRLGPDLRTCVDIDECVLSGGGVCPRHRKCVNTFGSFVCKCHLGFKLVYINGRYTCIDKDSRPFCSLNPSSPKCRCKDGGCEAVPKVTVEPQRPRTTTPITTSATAAQPVTTTTITTTSTAAAPTTPTTTVRTTAVTTTPVTATPVTTTPVTTTPVTATPVTTTPVTTTPVTTTPVTTTPVTATPVTATPVTTTPVTTTPVTTTPVTATTASATPVTATAVTTTPVAATAVTATTASATAVTTTPVTATPVTTTPVTTTPVTTTPVTTTPVTATPVTATPVTTTPVTTTPVTTTPVTATTASATPVTATAVTTTPVAATAVTATAVTATPVTATPVTTTPVTATPVTATPASTTAVTSTPVTTTPVVTMTTLAADEKTTPTNVALTTTASMETTTLSNRINKDVTHKQRGDVHIPRQPNHNQVWEFDIELGNTADDAGDDPGAGVLHCTFDQGVCDWLSDREGDVPWETAVSPSGGTYVSVPEQKAGQRSIRGARLTVDIVPPWSFGDLCFSFSHWLTGYHVGVLQLFTRKKGRGQRYSHALWSRTGGHGWRQTQVTLTMHSLDKLLLKAERRRGRRGRIAVDDVTLRQGACR